MRGGPSAAVENSCRSSCRGVEVGAVPSRPSPRQEAGRPLNSLGGVQTWHGSRVRIDGGRRQARPLGRATTPQTLYRASLISRSPLLNRAYHALNIGVPGKVHGETSDRCFSRRCSERLGVRSRAAGTPVPKGVVSATSRANRSLLFPSMTVLSSGDRSDDMYSFPVGLWTSQARQHAAIMND